MWSIYKTSADKYIAEGCGAAGLAADCVGIDIDTTGDPSSTTIHPCGILEWDRKDPLYAGDRVTVKLQSPCSDDGFTAGEGGAGGGATDVTDPTAITDPTDITDGTDPTDITNNTDSTEDTAGGDGDGGESTTSQ